jgi:hypothetical protein
LGFIDKGITPFDLLGFAEQIISQSEIITFGKVTAVFKEE